MKPRPFYSRYSRSDLADEYIDSRSIVEVVRLTDAGLNGLSSNNAGAYLICDCRADQDRFELSLNLNTPYLIVDKDLIFIAQDYADEALAEGLRGYELIAYIEKQLQVNTEISSVTDDVSQEISGLNSDDWVNADAAE